MNAPFNPWTVDAAYGRDRMAMTSFSNDLLRALHRQHPRILDYHAKQGRKVAAP